MMLRAALPIVLVSSAAAGAATPSEAFEFVREQSISRYRLAQADLNDDGRPEALIYAIDSPGKGEADMCGSGGCPLYILAFVGNEYRLVTKVSISRLPIRVLATTTHGWHDLAVRVAGGGIIAGRDARLRFDGETYPRNPSQTPALRPAEAIGELVMNETPLETQRAVESVLAHLDLTSFPNSTGPRRVLGKKSLADYGFTAVELTEAGAIAYRPDGGWRMSFRIVSRDSVSMQTCFGDRGLLRPQDRRAPSYHARSALDLSRSDGAWLQAAIVPAGFESCDDQPAVSE